MSRIDRLTLRAFITWQTLTVRAGLACTRAACALPSDRKTQDRALYAVAIVALGLVWWLA